MKRTIFLMLALCLMLTACSQTPASTPTGTSLPAEPAQSSRLSQPPQSTEPAQPTEPAEPENVQSMPEPEPEPEPENLHGILAVSLRKGEQYLLKNKKESPFTSFTVNLDYIDPQSGEVTHFRTFSGEGTKSYGWLGGIVGYGGSIGYNTAYLLSLFSEDMTKMVAEMRMEDGTHHIGWCDENGQFTDVSAKITRQNDFGGLMRHENAYFFDGYIYFQDLTNSNQIKRVPIDDLTPEAVEMVIDGYGWNDFSVRPDGTVSPYGVAYYYDESMQYAVSLSGFTDWVDASHVLGSDEGMIYIYELKVSGFPERTPLLPKINGRVNWDAVTSPDGSEAAFLSRLTSDNSTSLFIVPIDGGDPVKVPTDYVFQSDYSQFSNYLVGLMDWTSESPAEGQPAS